LSNELAEAISQIKPFAVMLGQQMANALNNIGKTSQLSIVGYKRRRTRLPLLGGDFAAK
jgi:hypothetical protein